MGGENELRGWGKTNERQRRLTDAEDYLMATGGRMDVRAVSGSENWILILYAFYTHTVYGESP